MDLEILKEINHINKKYSLNCEVKVKSIRFIKKLHGDNSPLDVSIFKKKCPWRKVAVDVELSFNFIENFIDYLDFGLIAQCQVLSEGFMEKHQEKLNWSMVSQHQNLSENFIEKHQDKVEWSKISLGQKLSEKFIMKFEHKVSWNNILIFQKVSSNFREQYSHLRW